MFLWQKQAADAIHENSSSGGEHGLAGYCAILFERSERRDIGAGIGTLRHDQVVTTVLALGADNARDPPHGGVVEEQSFDKALQQVYRVVVAPDVREFMDQDGFHLAG